MAYGMGGVLSRMAIVLLLHAALFYAAARFDPDLRERIEPLFVSLIAPPQPLPQAPPARPPAMQPAPQARAPRAEPTLVSKSEAPNAIAIEAPPLSPAILPPPGPAPTGVKATPPEELPPVVSPRFDAAYLNNPSPIYPAPSRRRGEQGRVELRVHVTAAGTASRVELHASSGFPALDQAAQDAVARWRFVPARQGDRAVDAWVIVPIVFSLEG